MGLGLLRHVKLRFSWGCPLHSTKKEHAYSSVSMTCPYLHSLRQECRTVRILSLVIPLLSYLHEEDRMQWAGAVVKSGGYSCRRHDFKSQCSYQAAYNNLYLQGSDTSGLLGHRHSYAHSPTQRHKIKYKKPFKKEIKTRKCHTMMLFYTVKIGHSNWYKTTLIGQ